MNDQYFSRAATWHRPDEHIVVNDSFSPNALRMITMEPWHEVVFMAADGEHTVAEFVRHMSSQYPETVPIGLREQIHGIITTSAAEGILPGTRLSRPTGYSSYPARTAAQPSHRS